jgi:hypothetical protein
MGRQAPEASYIALKSAAHLLIRQLGGLDAAATYTRVGKSALARYYDHNCPDFMPLDVALDLMLAARCMGSDATVARTLAELLGFQLVRPESGGALGDWLRHTCSLSAQAVQVANEVAIAASDGAITKDEAQSILPQITNVARATATLHESISRIAQEA